MNINKNNVLRAVMHFKHKYWGMPSQKKGHLGLSDRILLFIKYFLCAQKRGHLGTKKGATQHKFRGAPAQ